MRVLAFNVAHDSSVCSYVDGQIEFYCKEERLTRAKRDDCPFKALDLYHPPFSKFPDFISLYNISKYLYPNLTNYFHHKLLTLSYLN